MLVRYTFCLPSQERTCGLNKGRLIYYYEQEYFPDGHFNKYTTVYNRNIFGV